MRASLLDHPRVREFLDRNVLCAVSTGERRVALTFDDGPSPRNTPKLLDLLAEVRARATFFLLGRYVGRYRAVADRIVREGHEVANHGHWHAPLPLLPRCWKIREIEEGARRIERATGRRPRYYRPAMGWFNQQVLDLLRDRGQRPVIGSIHPRDSRRPGADSIVAHVMERIEPGAIVILHDGGWTPRVDRSQTLEAVSLLVPRLRERGYGFATLSELEAGGGSPRPSGTQP